MGIQTFERARCDRCGQVEEYAILGANGALPTERSQLPAGWDVLIADHKGFEQMTLCNLCMAVIRETLKRPAKDLSTSITREGEWQQREVPSMMMEDGVNSPKRAVTFGYGGQTVSDSDDLANDFCLSCGRYFTFDKSKVSASTCPRCGSADTASITRQKAMQKAAQEKA